ncbi:MAG TPA: isochorismatase family cysteine hydrolase [Acetivibrio sp.]|jgi:nicotinamidase-related amidase|nr:isochorismatase family cysteine hydrolase [Acetivibrio sp.]HPT91388.1 isochorismatase family cysteine hydrolase [Acetivibrio sp.]HQA58073.1 isochorismatase family cysteine hydrolase [Acetivibrio sp.]
MKKILRDDFIQKSGAILGEILETIEKQPVLDIKEIEPEKTVLVIVDMINGFAREGALKSPRVEEMIPEICRISKLCDKYKIKKIAFADNHTDKSPEFDAYPAHCLVGTAESEVVDEIKDIGGYMLIKKNSTNGFLEEEFQKWLKENPELDTFIVVGDCTDICVQQFAVTLKTYYNMKDKKSRIIVPLDAVDTFDLGQHYGDLMNVMAVFNMMGNGIEVVRGIKE